MTDQTLWIVRDPTGLLLPWTAAGRESHAKSHTQSGTDKTWEQLAEMGYRAVRVEVKEINGE